MNFTVDKGRKDINANQVSLTFRKDRTIGSKEKEVYSKMFQIKTGSKENEGCFLTSGGRYLVTGQSKDNDISPALSSLGLPLTEVSYLLPKSDRRILTQETRVLSN